MVVDALSRMSHCPVAHIAVRELEMLNDVAMFHLQLFKSESSVSIRNIVAKPTLIIVIIEVQ